MCIHTHTLVHVNTHKYTHTQERERGGKEREREGDRENGITDSLAPLGLIVIKGKKERAGKTEKQKHY